MAACAYTQTCFRDLLESQSFLLVNVVSSNDLTTNLKHSWLNFFLKNEEITKKVILAT